MLVEYRKRYESGAGGAAQIVGCSSRAPSGARCHADAIAVAMCTLAVKGDVGAAKELAERRALFLGKDRLCDGTEREGTVDEEVGLIATSSFMICRAWHQ